MQIRITRKLMLGMLAGTAMLAASAANAAEWRGWNIHFEGYPNTVALDKFAELVKERTEGRLELKNFHSGVLGSQPDAIEQVRVGAIAYGNFNLGPMGAIVPEADVVNLPFIFKGADHMHRVMDGPVGEEIAAAMAAKGLMSVAWYDSGARSFYNSQRPITKPEDMKGLKIRVMNNELFVGMIEALGGNATPMAFDEVYQSLKTGVVDGAENNIPSYDDRAHYEGAKYYSLSEHLIIPECICINTSSWEALSQEDKEIVKKAARESAELQRKLWAEREVTSQKKVVDAGVEYNEIEDKSAFQNAMDPVYVKAVEVNPALDALIKKIKAVD
jgi:tripartite ATP-independent transporter DctP family solute receptor